MTFIISRHLLWIAIVLVSCLQAQTFDLNGATGQIFHVDLAKREFVLLKAAEFAPQSDVGKSRFTVHWNEKTSIINVEERSDFSGIVGPVSAQFQGIDLAKVMNESPVFDRWRTTNHVHFYQKEEQRVLGEAFASAVRKALSAKKSSPDKKKS